MRFFLGLGSNVGDPRSNLNAALDALGAAGIRVVRLSSVYETEPVGGPAGQPAFLNQVVEVDSPFDARALLRATQKIEASLGRDRSREERWGPRTIDIDILCGDQTVEHPDLTIPHPRMAVRAFVLVPLSEIAPEALIGGSPIHELLDRVGVEGVRRVN